MVSVGIIGAGPVGSLAALGFAHKGYDVSLFDMRPDPRTIEEKALRSINLAVSDRGITAMKYVDEEMSERVLKEIIPMYGRMIHDKNGNEESQKYGLYGEHINSIDRSKLSEDLINEVELYGKSHSNPIKAGFEHKFVNAHNNNEHGGVTVEFAVPGEKDPISKSFDFIVGADGSYSRTRNALMKYVRLNYRQQYIDKCYIELRIAAGPDNTFKIDANHLHIWPRKEFMLIALPNADGSFTSTFFGPWELTESLDAPDKIEKFFVENFEDAVSLIGMENIVEAFLHHPKGALMQVHCSQYHYTDRCILIGDAAHSMVPFYGQGMNCGFEDVRVLLQLVDKYEGDRARAFSEYSATRHKDLEAILTLAMNNYEEMSTKVMSPSYLFRKQLDGVLGRLFPDFWIPLYTMVSFRADIPYSEVISTEKRQQKVLKGIETGISAVGLYFLGKKVMSLRDKRRA